MARAPAGSSFIADRDRWRIDDASRDALRKLLGAEPTQDQVGEVERAANDYLHERDRLDGGCDLKAARWELKQFAGALSVVVKFLDDQCDRAEPCEAHRRSAAAMKLMETELSFEGLPPAPAKVLTDISQAFLNAAAEAGKTKKSKAPDPALPSLLRGLWSAGERAGVSPTIRGHQGGREDRGLAEPWSPFVEFAFAIVESVAVHTGGAKPLRNSGFPTAVRDAIKLRGRKLRKSSPKSPS